MTTVEAPEVNCQESELSSLTLMCVIMSKSLTVLWPRSFVCKTSGTNLIGLMKRLSVRLLAKVLAENKLLINVSYYHDTKDKTVCKIIEPMVWRLTSKQVSAQFLLAFYICVNTNSMSTKDTGFRENVISV